MFPLDTYLKKASKAGYEVHETSRLNIVGWRNSLARANYFDCYLSLYWNEFTWHELHFDATTFPGVPWLLNPMHVRGTAVLKPGFYKEAYKLGKHKGYTALIQQKAVKVFRDNNRDGVVNFDAEVVYEGNFGINIHKASLANKYVGTSSAGCQVLKHRKDFDTLIRMCESDLAFYGNNFNYTLMEF